MIRQNLNFALVTVLFALLLPSTAAAGAGVNKILGTWRAEIVIEPNPLVGNTENVVVLEWMTFSRGGGLVATASLPYFVVPSGGTLRSALVSVGQSNWSNKGKTVQGTNWRFLNDRTTGEFLGFMKTRVEMTRQGNNFTGRYALDLLNPDLTPMRYQGANASFGPSPLTATKLAVETFE